MTLLIKTKPNCSKNYLLKPEQIQVLLFFKNWDQVEKAVKTMEDSAGSADNEMSIAADSIEFKLNKLSQTWVSFCPRYFISKIH